MKLCRDCKHYDWGLCVAPQHMTRIDPVTGAISAKWMPTCHGHRTFAFTGFIFCRFFGLCGAEGRWFEARKGAC